MIELFKCNHKDVKEWTVARVTEKTIHYLGQVDYGHFNELDSPRFSIWRDHTTLSIDEIKELHSAMLNLIK